MSDYSDYKTYKRFPIQTSSQTIMLIHLFSDNGHALDNALEGQDMWEENEAAFSYDIHENAAKQLFAQMEGHYCDSFLEELILEATRRLMESDARRKEISQKYGDNSFENRAKKALDKAANL